MPTSCRSILYVKPPAEVDPLPSILLQNHWNVHVATHSTAAVQLIGQHDFLVGLLYWDESDQEDMHAMRRQTEYLLDSNNRINWIALIANKTKSLSHIPSVLASHFYDYHTLPLDQQRLLLTIGHAHGMARIAYSFNETQIPRLEQCGIVGQSPVMRTLSQTTVKLAALDFNTMIRGESGTGKELIAKAVHDLSHRSDGPFVALNCGALPKDLIQAELFGHEKGAFTGADRRRVGRIEAAENGTLFLDEIGDLPLDLQANLLRFLQEKTIDRIGSSTSTKVDVRVITATHVNLEKAVEEKRFREDLYYRLNILHIEIPPLRKRGEDIELLANYFLEQCAKKIKPNLKGFSQQALDVIRSHPWPGNVREMKNRIQRAGAMCEGRLIRTRDLGLDQDTPNCTLLTLSQAREMAEKEAIKTTLSAARNNVSKAARRLDISRVTLYRLMEQHSIKWQKNQVE